ncbi:plasminogen activator inhibitor 1-like [Biomphalaria glabrata]|uniref:Plasminogen activator inhibitor 1-like n=1 Tax=Biomphalaria glabrata TaxID=6526 RepID=A0A9W2YKA1_BIOGL|nr:plasminogen activator inhibitor 1-like [Biomphalaria glabrata]
MTSTGARGDTATEMKNIRDITALGSSVNSIYKELIQQINAVTDVELYTANAVFVWPDLSVVPRFTLDLSSYYSAQANRIKFSAGGRPEKPINDDVAARTRNIITVLPRTSTVDNRTGLVLIDSLFFNGTWETPFEQIRTKSQDFHQLGGSVKQVEMMNDDRYVNIKRDDVNKVDVAELSFKGGRFSLYIALPHAVDGITDIEKLVVQPGKVQQLFTDLINVRVRLAIPKFKAESTLSPNTPLEDLGMTRAFSPSLANFGGIAAADLYISHVLHTAVLEVKESKTVAAAAADINIPIRTGFVMPPSESFVADHPFVYFLRDNQTGQILFQGKFSG